MSLRKAINEAIYRTWEVKLSDGTELNRFVANGATVSEMEKKLWMHPIFCCIGKAGHCQRAQIFLRIRS